MDFSHIEDERLRSILSSEVIAPADFEWAMQYTRDCLMLDDENEDVPDHIQRTRWEHYEAADYYVEAEAPAVQSLRKVWLI